MPRRTVLLTTTSITSTTFDMTRTLATIWLLLAALATLARGFPAAVAAGAAEDDDNSSGPLPFIQFTKGGIRVNFGGYHAQAGLGGLLTGSKADGGLHASAGTPSGAHASAGLGGSLDGGPAGGLHARAGLGNGGPEAEAGLAGSLTGPQPEGKIYAGSTAGNLDLEKTNSILRGDKSRSKNIQIINRNKKNNELDGAASSSVAASADGDFISNIKESSSSSSSSADTISNTTSAINEKDKKGKEDESEDEKSKHPARWYFKKRLAERVTAPPPSANNNNNKSTYNAIETPTPVLPSEEAPTSEQQQQPTTKPRPPTRQPWPYGIFARSPDTTTDIGTKTRTKGTLFDDIFNIPISALNAVNQLLKNHVGKKK